MYNPRIDESERHDSEWNREVYKWQGIKAALDLALNTFDNKEEDSQVRIKALNESYEIATKLSHVEHNLRIFNSKRMSEKLKDSVVYGV